ncbi:MAG: exodeoxyribonuclease VII small subunit [Anaerolineae bacterium]
MNNNQPALESMSFEQAYRALEETVQRLEAGNLPLEEAVALYQRGMELAKQCNAQLDNVELRIKLLTPSGELVDFEEE